MTNPSVLYDLQPGQEAVVQALEVSGSLRRRLLDLGLVENTPVRCLGRSILGDPSAYLIRGTVIALRARDSRRIRVCTG